ncbi:MAG TPA: hypothetical protein EYP33_02560 [Pyrodictium sp.]|nr:hypothetical protein [Pyrodictium sp.]
MRFLEKLFGRRAPPLSEAEAAVAASALAQSYPSMDLYTLLEDERISRELWAYVLSFATRDMKLTYFSDSDIRWLFYRTEALATWIEIALNSLQPPPSHYSTLEDYASEVYAKQLLADNLRLWMYAVARRSYKGFERLMLARRHVIVSLDRGEHS